MQLVTMKCPACGASVSVTDDLTQFTCEYCKNNISIIKPVEIENKFIEGLTEIQKQKFDNYVSILHQAMLAGNYSEAYTYCNKALEINPKAGGIWENKAICAFWLSSTKQLEEEKAIEIVTYLNASRQSDPNSPTYKSTCKDLASNLFSVICYLYGSIQFDNYINTPSGSSVSGYKVETQKRMLAYMRLLDVCYQIDANVLYLKEYVKAITTGRGIEWVTKYVNQVELINTQNSNYHNFDAVSKRNSLIAKIREVEPNYIPIDVISKKSTKNRDILIFLGVIIFFILLMVICSQSK